MLAIFLCWFIETFKNVFLPTSSCCPQESKFVGVRGNLGVRFNDLKDVGILMMWKHLLFLTFILLGDNSELLYSSVNIFS